ncbi:hypothetical protein [Vibrio sp. THAF190c]|jgi:hypothetical protein|uniref:hypothetical protein n=1 Tax=Vibrio sp. THAF190c TaxID=2587865 RepID=UPI001268631A|nr:hypothetical protein [Vibrio sp. THAF190c]QFT13306.1 hypothetical protein FIV04_25485 [Vibrio sp. THAF190c]
MVSHSTLMTDLANIETDLMIDCSLLALDPSYPVDPTNYIDQLEDVGARSAEHNIELNETLVKLLTEMEVTMPNALNIFLKGRNSIGF